MAILAAAELNAINFSNVHDDHNCDATIGDAADKALKRREAMPGAERWMRESCVMFFLVAVGIDILS